MFQLRGRISGLKSVISNVSRGRWHAPLLRAAAVVLLLPGALWAHDTWLVASSYQPQPGAKVRLSVATSEAFPTSDGAAAPDRIARFTVRTAAGEKQVGDYKVEGKFLVGEVALEAAGHAVTVVERKPQLIVLQSKLFNEYIGHEELKHVVEARAQAGHSDAEGREKYRKIAKAILCVGGGQPADSAYARPEGLWLEIIPERSPCGLRAGDALTVRVLFEGQPIAGVHVAAGYEGVTGHSYPVWIPTDAHGRATVKLDRAGVWFVRTLHMVPLQGDAEADWQSAFSTLTFDVLPAGGAGAEAEIRAVLEAQAAAWNQGDYVGFMSGFEKSDAITFSGSSGVTRGWETVLARYRSRYADRAAMGTLTFSDLEPRMLGEGAALVLGRWRIERQGGPIGGVFSLVLRKSGEGWRIIHDHTSSDE